MNKFKKGQKLIYKPNDSIDDHYEEGQEVVYVGPLESTNRFGGYHIVETYDGKLLPVGLSSLHLPKKKIPLWEAMGDIMEKEYDWDFETFNHRKSLVREFLCTTRKLGITLPEYIEVEE